MATPVIARRTYLALRAMERGATMQQAIEAVATTEAAHPEWNLGERRSWWEWAEAEERGEGPP